MRAIIISLFLLVPLCSNAQKWRIQALGGIATASTFRRNDDIVIGLQVPGMATNTLITSHMPSDNAVFASWGLSFFRRSGNGELGLQAEAMSLRTRFDGSAVEPGTGGTPTFTPFSLTAYVGRPVVLVTIAYNYYAGRGRASGYVGLHAGVAYAPGQRQADFSDMAVTNDIRLYYNSTWGIVAGLQAGYRKELGPLDLGFQLQLKYMRFNLQHGSSETTYRTRLLVPQAGLHAGYRFGKKQSPAKRAEAPTN